MTELLTQLENVDIGATMSPAIVGSDDKVWLSVAGQVLADGEFLVVAEAVAAWEDARFLKSEDPDARLADFKNGILALDEVARNRVLVELVRFQQLGVGRNPDAGLLGQGRGVLLLELWGGAGA